MNSELELLVVMLKVVKVVMDNVNGCVLLDCKVNGYLLFGDIILWVLDVKVIFVDVIGQIIDNGMMVLVNISGWWWVVVLNFDMVVDFLIYLDGSKLYSYGYMFVEKIGEVWFQYYYVYMGVNVKCQDWGMVLNISCLWVIDYNIVNKFLVGDVGVLLIIGGWINGFLGIGIDNVLGGSLIVFGDNDIGFKWYSDGVLGIYVNNVQVGYIDNFGFYMLVDICVIGIVCVGNGKILMLLSGNNFVLNVGFSLWGGGECLIVIEFSDDQGWYLYSQ